VTPAPAESEPEADAPSPPLPDGEEAATARINLRLPEQLKSGIEQAAAAEQLSVNAWAIRRLAAAVSGDPRGRPRPRGSLGQSFTGWVR
jgi:hypothetical protein